MSERAVHAGLRCAQGSATCLALLLALVFSAAVSAAESGWFGVALSVEAEESADPTLRSVVIVSVVPGSPAALAGVRPGDDVVAVGDLVVAGAKASAFKRATQKSVGETMQLKLKRDKAVRQVALVGVPKPAGP